MVCFCCVTPLGFFLAVVFLVWLGKHGFFDSDSTETEAN